jgi:hypothetical protein
VQKFSRAKSCRFPVAFVSLRCAQHVAGCAPNVIQRENGAISDRSQTGGWKTGEVRQPQPSKREELYRSIRGSRRKSRDFKTPWKPEFVGTILRWYYEIMRFNRIDMVDALLVALAIPLWSLLILATSGSPGFGGGFSGYVIPSFVLVAMTATLYWMLRTRKHAVALSSLLAAVIIWMFLLSVNWYSAD